MNCDVCGKKLRDDSIYGVCRRGEEQCRREYTRRRRNKVREYRRKWLIEYRHKNVELMREHGKRYYLRHVDDKKARTKLRYRLRMLTERIRKDETKLARELEKLEREITCRKQTRSQLAAAKRQLKLLKSYARNPSDPQVLRKLESELRTTSRT